jgi:hypothetical protein
MDGQDDADDEMEGGAIKYRMRLTPCLIFRYPHAVNLVEFYRMTMMKSFIIPEQRCPQHADIAEEIRK